MDTGCGKFNCLHILLHPRTHTTWSERERDKIKKIYIGYRCHTPGPWAIVWVSHNIHDYRVHSCQFQNKTAVLFYQLHVSLTTFSAWISVAFFKYKKKIWNRKPFFEMPEYINSSRYHSTSTSFYHFTVNKDSLLSLCRNSMQLSHLIAYELKQQNVFICYFIMPSFSLFRRN